MVGQAVSHDRILEKRREGVVRERHSGGFPMNVKMMILALSVAIVLPLIIMRLLSKYPHDLMTSIGIGLIIPSFIFLLAAFYQLGSSLAVTAQARELVTTGLYAKIRHPIYIFGALLFLGFAMVSRDVLTCVLFVIVLADGMRRARKENRVLEEEFGDAYRAYRSHVWF
jgi:protein-S-isoprenylcysteine O-methyltransferase Ste14